MAARPSDGESTLSADQRCSVLQRAAGRPLPGTAPVSRGWLLITDPGPWAPQALTGHRLEPAQGRQITERASASGLRPLLIRRHGRQASERRFAVVDSADGLAQWQGFQDFADILTAVWEPTVPMVDPMYLVCTHGARDACCAVDGRPVAAALNELRPQDTWECSHIGGHRFAANVVVLPHGLVYGAVTPDDAAELVAATEAGQFVPRLLRGRCTEPPAVQAGRIVAARDAGNVGICDLVLSASESDADSWRMEFAAPQLALQVVARRSEHEVIASCGKAPTTEEHWVARLISTSGA